MYKLFFSTSVLIFVAIFPLKGWTDSWESIEPAAIPADYGQPWNTASSSDLAEGLWLVNFWATWCAPCIKELPDLQNAAQQLAPDVQVALVNVGETPEQIARYAQENPQLGLQNGAAVFAGMEFRGMQAWQLRGLPTTVLVRHGQKVAQFEGVKPWHEPQEVSQIQALLGTQ